MSLAFGDRITLRLPRRPAGPDLALPVFLAAAVLAFLPAWRRMVELWLANGTYSHGLWVVPAAAWMVWLRRAELARLQRSPDWRALPVLALLVPAWTAARVAEVDLVAQLAAVGAVPLAVWLFWGVQALRLLAYPMAYLLFAVPMGESLIDPLIDLTARATVWGLQLSGIPVYAEGRFFVIPSGTWAVETACSGQRYLIAAVALGAVYAYAAYRSPWRRAAFLAVAVVIPLLANLLRAYLIVLAGHLSGMRLAVGADHLIYGWVFFLLVMILVFWIGGRWREPPTVAAAPEAPAQSTGRGGQRPFPAGVFAAALLLLVLGPVWTAVVAQRQAAAAVALQPVELRGWSCCLGEAPLHWRPHYTGARESWHGVYRRGERWVGVHRMLYGPGEEIVRHGNVVVPERDPVWREIGAGVERTGAGAVSVHRLRSAAGDLLVWVWYRAGGHHFASALALKAWRAVDRMRGGDGAAEVVFVYTPADPDPAAARAQLEAFLVALGRALAEDPA